jgi:hypothetical protein
MKVTETPAGLLATVGVPLMTPALERFNPVGSGFDPLASDQV